MERMQLAVTLTDPVWMGMMIGVVIAPSIVLMMEWYMPLIKEEHVVEQVISSIHYKKFF